MIGENKNNRIVVVNGTRELPQTNENSNLIVSLIGLLLLPVFFLGKLITERFIK
ncbi:LPXTG cell wall anchor domain-containing protein [Levilactobacillus brevis]